MANKEHLAVLKTGVKAWNSWRKEYPNIAPDLSGAELSGGNYIDDDPRDTRGINFDRTDLRKSKLRDTYFYDAYMRLADLSEADLCGATVYNSNLIGANLQEASLDETNLGFSFLMEANLSRTWLRHTLFTLASLTDARVCSQYI